MLSTLLKASLPPEVISKDPMFVSSSSVYSTGTTGVVTSPADIQDGDILIAFSVAFVSSTITLPSGFTSVSSSSTTRSYNLGYKIASNETGNYTFSFSTTQNAVSLIMVYRNLAYNAVGSVTSATEDDLSTASAITSPQAGANIYFFTAGSSTGIGIAPTNATQRVFSQNSGVTVAVYDKIIGYPLSETLTLTWSSGNIPVLGIQMNLAG